LIRIKAAPDAEPHGFSPQAREQVMTFQDIYLYGVIAAFAVFMVTLFAVSAMGWLKK
jgi:hypothetical protein